MIFGKRGFRKFVPTDMSWATTYRGGLAEVSVMTRGRPDEPLDYYVVIHGTDDTTCQRWFETWEDALALYNRLTYLQSYADLAEFGVGYNLEPIVGAVIDNNGWPDERPKYTYPWYDEQEFEDPDYWDFNSEFMTSPEEWGVK